MDNEYITTPAVPEPEAQPVPAESEAPVPADGYEDVSAFVGTFEDSNIPDPSTVITIRTSGGDTRYVPVADGTQLTAGEAFMATGLSVTGAFQIYLNGAMIKVTDVVPAGSTLTVVGNVKGGAF